MKKNAEIPNLLVAERRKKGHQRQEHVGGALIF